MNVEIKVSTILNSFCSYLIPYFNFQFDLLVGHHIQKMHMILHHYKILKNPY